MVVVVDVAVAVAVAVAVVRALRLMLMLLFGIVATELIGCWMFVRCKEWHW